LGIRSYCRKKRQTPGGREKSVSSDLDDDDVQATGNGVTA